jgi:hypothetical protein
MGPGFLSPVALPVASHRTATVLLGADIHPEELAMIAVLRAVSWPIHAGRLSFLLLCLIAGAAPAQDLVKVEEDWELVIGEPDVNSAGPQVATTMSPFGDIHDTHFTFEINHKSVPYWAPGGLTLHQWSGGWRIQTMDRPDRSVMQTQAERVTWTQILEVEGGHLTFQVKNGASTTWGPFGYTNYLKLNSNWGVENINSYSPDVSAALSGVSYAGNRVQSLKILRVRATLSDGATATDETVRVVHEIH